MAVRLIATWKQCKIYDWSQTFVRIERGSDLRESDSSEVFSTKTDQNYWDHNIVWDPTDASPTYPTSTVEMLLYHANVYNR